MADLIPPVPNTDFQTTTQIFTWKDWFRRLRNNINAFAIDITDILAELAAQDVLINQAIDDIEAQQLEIDAAVDDIADQQTEINNILTQITTVSSSGDEGISADSFTTVNTITYPDLNITSSMSVDGSYPLLFNGYLIAEMSFTTLNTSYVEAYVRVEQDSGATFIIAMPNQRRTATVRETGVSNAVTFVFPIVYEWTTPTSGSHSYNLEFNANFFDNTLSPINSTGFVSLNSYLYIKEVKT